MKLISVQSRGDRLARIVAIHDDNPDFVHFCGKEFHWNYFSGFRSSVMTSLNCDLPTALKAAAEWLRKAKD